MSLSGIHPSQTARWLCLLALLPLPAGCGGEETEPAPPLPSGCEEPEVALPDGSCFRPGVPPDGCGEGFVHDGRYGCEPILPPEPCPPGQMAVPGEETCHSVMDCGEGTWGSLPVDGTTQFVDGSYSGGDGDGSEARPWPTIGEAVDAAAPGALIAVAAGTYGEALLIRYKAVRLWGRCPELVTIEAPSEPAFPCTLAALCVLDGADGTEVGGLTLTGPGRGLFLSGSEGVTLDRVHVLGNAGAGVHAETSVGPTTIHLRDSLIEGNHQYGLFDIGAQVTVDTTVVRSTQPDSSGQDLGMGLYFQVDCTETGGLCHPPEPTTATVTRSLIELNHETSVLVMGAEATLEASVVRATAPLPATLDRGNGIQVQAHCSQTTTGVVCDPTARGRATVARSLVEQHHGEGMLVYGSDATLEGTVVRANLPSADDLTFGRGIHLGLPCQGTTEGYQCDAAMGSTATVTGSLIEQNHELGIFVGGSQATVDRTVIRAIWPLASDQTRGRAIQVQIPCDLAMADYVCDPAARSTAQITESLIEDTFEFGICVTSSDATLSRSVVRNTWPRANAGLFGDGVAIMATEAPASATIDQLLIVDSARAGIASFGASISLSGSHIRCAPFALNGEVLLGNEFQVEDLGGNLCGCPTATEACKLMSAGLEPPDAL